MYESRYITQKFKKHNFVKFHSPHDQDLDLSVGIFMKSIFVITRSNVSLLLFINTSLSVSIIVVEKII